MARVAMALPIELVVKGLPVGERTRAPAFRARSARRMSAVITIAPGADCSAIQSSAASKASLTTSAAEQGVLGHAEVLVADHDHGDLVAEGDLVDLLLHRAGIGVDEDAGDGHGSIPPVEASGFFVPL